MHIVLFVLLEAYEYKVLKIIACFHLKEENQKSATSRREQIYSPIGVHLVTKEFLLSVNLKPSKIVLRITIQGPHCIKFKNMFPFVKYLPYRKCFK
jgi:hypothetical protein